MAKNIRAVYQGCLLSRIVHYQELYNSPFCGAQISSLYAWVETDAEVTCKRCLETKYKYQIGK